DVAHLFVGLQTDADDVFILNEVSRNKDQIECESAATGERHRFEAAHLKSFLKGSLDIRRYGFSGASKRLVFPYQNESGRSTLISAAEYADKFPLTWKYLEANRSRLAKRAKGALGANWHGYVYKKNHVRFQQPKILAPAIATGACFAWDAVGDYYFVGSGGGGGGGYGIVPDPELDWSPLFLLGILNSRLTTFFLKKTSSAFRGGYIALNRQYIEEIALPDVKGKSPTHDRIVALVEKMLDLHRQRAAVKTPHEQTALDRQISATDTQMDRLVYDLYGLTEEEIKLVEGA
ncbi:MAG: restriction endonuclease subunit M, partial [Verrucomicrobiales bacterium VVV1]